MNSYKNVRHNRFNLLDELQAFRESPDLDAAEIMYAEQALQFLDKNTEWYVPSNPNGHVAFSALLFATETEIFFLEHAPHLSQYIPVNLSINFEKLYIDAIHTGLNTLLKQSYSLHGIIGVQSHFLDSNGDDSSGPLLLTITYACKLDKALSTDKTLHAFTAEQLLQETLKHEISLATQKMIHRSLKL